MKRSFYILIFICIPFLSKGQDVVLQQIDSLMKELTHLKMDTARVAVLVQLGELWQNKDLLKSTHYVEEALLLSKKLKLTEQTHGIMFQLAYNAMLQSDAPKSIHILQELIRLLPKNGGGYQTALAFLSLTYKNIDDYDNALLYLQQSFELNERLRNEGKPYDERGYLGGPINMAEIFEKKNRLDSALYYAQMAYKRLAINPAPLGEESFKWEIPWSYGIIESRLNRDNHAAELYFVSLKEAQKQGYNIGIESVELSLANHYNKINQVDSALLYATHAFESAQRTPTLQVISEAGFLLKKLYVAQQNHAKALYYNDLAHIAKDSLINVEKLRNVQALMIKEERRRQETEMQRIASENHRKQIGLVVGLLIYSSIAFFLYRNNRQKQKLNEQLLTQKAEIEALNNGLEQKVEVRTNELKKALDEVQTAFNEGQTTERKRVSADLHDEIGSALSTIAIFSDLAKNKAQKFAPELVTELERIGRKSRDMIQTMRDTIWTLNEDSPQSVWERMHISSSETLSAKNIVLHWRLLPENDLPNLPFNTKRNLFLAYKEAINNIVKHADATTVIVETRKQEGQFMLKIKDNGKGFDRNKEQKRGNGLHNFEKRMVEIDGITHIESVPNQGTCITFSLSIDT